ncbi:Glycerol-3-phosphate phosphatase [Nymphon striatum]|nr:Glycerol-3-phosphate phosphatase [Nymphon striatum]
MSKTVKIDSNNIKEFMDSFDTALVDCDGVIWHGDNALKGAASTLSTFKKMGKRVLYVSNNSTKSLEDYMAKFQRLKFDVAENEIFFPSVLVAKYLIKKKVEGSVYVIGSKGITDELDKVGIKHSKIGADPVTRDNHIDWILNDLHLDKEVGAVVMGFDPHISLSKYTKACSYLRNPKCHFILTNADRMFPIDSQAVLPGTGALVSPIITGSEREPVILGKPHSFMFDSIQDVHKINPSRTIMIGDNMSTDMAFGYNNNFFATVLVLTGVCQWITVEKCMMSKNEEDRKMIPTHFIEKISDFGELIKQKKLA